MKSCFLIILMLLTGLVYANDTVLLEDDARLVFENSVLLFNGDVFYGSLQSKYPQGDLKSIDYYVDGLRDGPSISWYEGGQKMRKAVFVQGKRQGLAQAWWSNGQTQSERHYLDGQLDGEARTWTESGQPKHLQNFSRGRENGLQRGWHEDGELAFSYVFRDGRRYGLLGSKPCFSVSVASTEYFNEGL